MKYYKKIMKGYTMDEVKPNKILECLPLTACILAVALLLLANKQKYIPQNNIITIACILFFISFAVDLYMDIKSRKCMNSVFIIIADVIKMIAFIVICYYSFKPYEKTNIDLLWKRHDIISYSGLVISIMEGLKSVFEGKNSQKNKDSNDPESSN